MCTDSPLLQEQDLLLCGIEKEERILCAFSGGADSLALLLELKRLAAEKRIAAVGAAHFHHGIRGAEADGDLDFCRVTSENAGIPFYSAIGDVPAAAKASGESCETAARRLRYAFLEKTATEEGYSCIALAHHESDQAETVLMHLVRGSGLGGLTGMAPRSGKIVRPLLRHSREEILQFLREKGRAYRTDSTNASLEADRNRFRLCVIPELTGINPQAEHHIAEAAEKLRREDDYLRLLAENAAKECGGLRSKIARQPEVLRRRILLSMLRAHTEDYCSGDICKLEALLPAPSGKTAELTGGWKARTEQDALFFFREEEENTDTPLTLGVPLRVRGGLLRAEASAEYCIPCPKDTAFADADKIRGGLHVRFFEPGERFVPFGLRGTKLFSDYFTDKKVPLSERRVPVVFDEEKAVYICGYTVDDRVKITDDTEKIIRFQFTKGE